MTNVPPLPGWQPGRGRRSYDDYAVIRKNRTRGDVIFRRVVVIVVLLSAFMWWRTADQWKNRGCTGAQGLHYALTEGEPEWYQYCKPTPEGTP